MQESVYLIWACIYAWAGWLLGGLIGWPWLGGIAGFIAGTAAGSAVVSDVPIEVSLLAMPLALAAWLLVPAKWLPHAVGALCAMPFAGLAFLAARRAVREARGRRIVAEAATLEALVELTGSKQPEIRAALHERCARLELPPGERARLIVQLAAGFEHGSTGDSELLAVLAAPLAQSEPAPRDELLLLYERLGWITASRWSTPGNADELIQSALFDRVEWDDDAPLLRAARSRIEKGWNVDRMVARLLDTDPETGARMAQDAFTAGALDASLLLRAGESRAAPVIAREIARATTSKIKRYDRIIEAALGLPPGKAFTLLARVLEWDPADYSIEGVFEHRLLKEERPGLEERCSRAPAETASFLVAVRARIDLLERYDWDAKFYPGWHPQARLKMWSELASALESGRRS